MDEAGRLVCSVRFAGREVLRPWPIGLVLDGVDCGLVTKLGAGTYTCAERFPCQVPLRSL